MSWWLAVFAVARAAEVPVDLEAALALALRDGIDAQEARVAEDAARSVVTRRRQAGLPSLDAWARAGVDVAAAGATPSASVGLSSTTTLWAGGTLAASSRAAAAQLEAAGASRERVEAALRLGLAGALLDVAAAEAEVEAGRATVAAEEAIARRIQSAVEAGARTRADALQQTAAAARARAELVAAERDDALARLALVELLRLDAGRAWAFRAPADGPVVDPDVAALLVRAEAGRPELRAHRAAVAAAEADLAAVRGEGLPAVALQLGASTSLGDDGPVGSQLGDRAGASAVLAVDVPLYQRGVVRDEVRQAELVLEAARRAEAHAREAMGIDVRAAVVELRAAAAALEAARVRDEAGRAAVAVVGDRYEAGAAVLSELLAARAELADAERARITAEVDVVRARFGVAWAVGD